MRNRIQRVFRNSLKETDAILIKNSSTPFIDDNFFYITGLTQGLFEGSIALIGPNGSLDLVVSALEEESAQKADATLHVFKTLKEQYAIVKDILKSKKTIGINSNTLTFYDFSQMQKNIPQKTFIDIADAFRQTRLIKETKEIKMIQKACNISDAVMNKIPTLLREGLTENELAAEINYHLQKMGAEKPAFDTISSFNTHTAEPHYTHAETPLKKNVFVLCDFGACYRKYNADITRTFVYGSASQKQKEIYEIVAEAQQLGVNSIEPGKKANVVHKQVAERIDSTKFKGRFIHSTGHSLGLAVHDNIEGLSPNSTLKLEENMVVTVEPGIYVPDFGGVRIEDTVLVTKKGARRLTNSTHALIEIN